jgi:trimethyllysine dioxygenase
MIPSYRFVSLLLSRVGSRVRLRRCCTNSAIEKEISTIPWQYLRAMDPKNFDPRTGQRNDVAFNAQDGKPLLLRGGSSSSNVVPVKIVSCSRNGSRYHVVWTDGRESYYSIDWVHSITRKKNDTSTTRILWTGLTEDAVRGSSRMAMSFPDVIQDEEAALHALYRYGFVLITGTPIAEDAIAALASALSDGSIKHPQTRVAQYRAGKRPLGTDGPLRTLYGTVWSTAAAGQVGASTADSSYGSEGLPLHTDLTYYASPPGLQIFTMVQPAPSGGATILADGFGAATQLRNQHPEAFALLSRIPRRYRCIDSQTGWHLQASGPVIQRNETGDIVMIRHNDLDRLPDLPPPPPHTIAADEEGEDADSFYRRLYQAHHAWDRILADDAVRLVLSLQPGDTLVVANQVRFLSFVRLLSFRRVIL